VWGGHSCPPLLTLLLILTLSAALDLDFALDLDSVIPTAAGAEATAEWRNLLVWLADRSLMLSDLKLSRLDCLPLHEL